MKIINQKGFHLLHVALALVIVAVIAIIGAKVLTKSHAATLSGTLYCSSSFGAMTSDGRIPFTLKYWYSGAGSSGSSTSGIMKVWYGSNYRSYSHPLPSMVNGQTPNVWSGSLGPYERGTGKITTGAYKYLSTGLYYCVPSGKVYSR